ncbi:MAG: hypothetical protein ACFFBS_09805 [Promethearchaeota archaeon]
MPLGWFRRKKENEPDEKVEQQVGKLAYELREVPRPEIDSEIHVSGSASHKFTTSKKTFAEWLDQTLQTPDIAEKSKALGNISMQFYSAGVPFFVSKHGVRSLELTKGRQVKNDVVITISDLAEKKLLKVSDFEDFEASYHRLVSNPSPQEYVRIKLMDDLSELRKKGYFRLRLLRTLIQA